MLLLLADSELRQRAPLVLAAAAAATQEAAHPKAATILHGGAHHGELGCSLPLAGERGTPRRQEERAWRRAGWVRRRAS